MVAHVLRLRLVSLVGALRGGRAHLVRMLIGLALLATAVIAAAIGLLSLREAPDAVTSTVIVLSAAAATLGFAVAPLALGAVDPLDPRRFAVTGLAPGPLSAVLAVAGLLSVPSLVLTTLGICIAVVWIAHGASAVLAIVSVVLGVLTCVMAVRVGEALAALVIRERRSRELSGLFVVGVLIVVVPVGVFLASLDWNGTVPIQLREAVDVVALTPIGAAWALPGLDGSSLVIAIAVALATLVVLVLAWVAIVRRMLTTTERPLAVRERGGLGWFAVAPGTPAGAVAARSLVYWLRDRRYLVNVLVVPFAAVLTVVPLLFVGVPVEFAALVPVTIVALFFGWMPHNDLAYDSTAIWMHIASGVRGAADRIGRLVPILLIGLPVLAIAVPVTIAVQGRWAVLPALAGVCASLFLSGLGLSSIASAVAPYPVSRPGDSPFQQPQRTGSGGVTAQALVMLGAIILSAPALWWGWLTLSRDVASASIALWVGIGEGLIVLAAGIAIGAAVFQRSGNRLMEFAESS